MVQGFSKGYLGVGRRITGELVNLVLHTKLTQRTIPSMVLQPQKALKKLSMRM